MIILKTAWKNIWRKRVRSFVILTANVIGLTCGLIAIAFATGFVNQIVDSVIDVETSHIVMQADSFNINQDIRHIIQHSDILTQEMISVQGVEASCDRLKTPGYISTAHTSVSVNLIGVIPENVLKVFNLQVTTADSCGGFLTGNISHPMVIGRILSKRLNADLNSRLVATFQSVDGELASSMFRVAGIFESENYLFERTAVFVLKEDLAILSGLDLHNSHEIAIKTSGRLAEVNNIMAGLSEKFPEYHFNAWHEIRPSIGIFYSYVSLINTITIGIILLALCFGILNNMLMVILERRHEFGMLRAIGMNNKKVFYMVMLETSLLVVTGAVVSMVISWLLLQWLGETGINMHIPASAISEIPVGPERVFPFLEMHQYIKIIIMVIITGVIAAVFPMKQVLKTSPADALRRLK